MSREREAAIHRELARLHAELADEIEGVEPEDRPSRPRPKPRIRRAPTIVRPEGEADDLTRAKAQRFLRQNGWTKA